MGGSGRHVVYQQIQEALLYYSRYKAGAGVPHLFKAYLDTFEEQAVVCNYVLGLKSLEQKAVKMYLDGKRVEAIARAKCFVENATPVNDIRIWVFGNRENFGLVNTMYNVFMKQSRFCPFCHDQKRWGDGYYQKRVHGSVCPHREIWEAELMEEWDA
mgnify:CR=1 FL=1